MPTNDSCGPICWSSPTTTARSARLRHRQREQVRLRRLVDDHHVEVRAAGELLDGPVDRHDPDRHGVDGGVHGPLGVRLPLGGVLPGPLADLAQRGGPVGERGPPPVVQAARHLQPGARPRPVPRSAAGSSPGRARRAGPERPGRRCRRPGRTRSARAATATVEQSGAGAGDGGRRRPRSGPSSRARRVAAARRAARSVARRGAGRRAGVPRRACRPTLRGRRWRLLVEQPPQSLASVRDMPSLEQRVPSRPALGDEPVVGRTPPRAAATRCDRARSAGVRRPALLGARGNRRTTPSRAGQRRGPSPARWRRR